MTDNEIDELLGITKEDFDKNSLKARKNGLLLTDNQVSTFARVDSKSF